MGETDVVDELHVVTARRGGSNRTFVLVAAVSVLICAAFMALNVRWNYGGNVTGLFYTGRETSLPPELEAEPTVRVNDPKGYDAQFYHLITHDPWLRKGWSDFVDNPRLRWRRIGLAGAAATLALVPGVSVHWSYVALQLVAVFFGAYWLSWYASSLGRSPLFGLAFLGVPAVLVSIDRMTVDLALASLVIGLVVCASRRASPVWPVYLILCFAPLVRETGILLIAGWVIWCGLRRRWMDAAAGLACALPAIAWWSYVHVQTVPDGTPWHADYPFAGLVRRVLAGDRTPTTSLWLRLAGLTEMTATAGVIAAIGCALVAFRKRTTGLVEITAVIFVGFFSMLGRYDIWDTAYAAGRTLSPVLILLGLIALRESRWLYVLPAALILPRILLQYEAQMASALRAAVSGK